MCGLLQRPMCQLGGARCFPVGGLWGHRHVPGGFLISSRGSLGHFTAERPLQPVPASLGALVPQTAEGLRLDHGESEVGPELGWPTDLDRNYRIGSFLGAGSYGVCHHATHLATGRTYAVKMLSKERPNAPRARTLRRLQREAELLERLRGSGNVVQLQHKFESQNAVYFVLELCRGVDLQELLMERGTLDEATAARVVYECLRVLQACHAAGVVHNDIKPGNFMVDLATLDGACSCGWVGECAPAMPLVKLLDFGCSQPLRADGQPLTKRTGTPVFMAPEMYKKSYSTEADLWSLGMMTHQLLSGRFPFLGTVRECLASSVSDVMHGVLYGQLDLAGAGIQASCSPECCDLLRRLLERDPKDRITVDQALAHPWFARFGRPCDHGGVALHTAAAPTRNNVVPFPRAEQVASADAVPPLVPPATEGAGERVRPVAVWALMHSSPCAAPMQLG